MHGHLTLGQEVNEMSAITHKERLLRVLRKLEKTGKRDSWLYHVARALPVTVILKFKNSWFPVSPVVSALEKWRSGERIAFSYFIRPPEHPHRDLRAYLRVAEIKRKIARGDYDE